MRPLSNNGSWLGTSLRQEVDGWRRGKNIRWAFKDVGVELDVKVNKVEPDKFVSFTWAASGVEATVEISLEPDDKDSMMAYVSESGWSMDELGVGRLVEQSKGWVGFLRAQGSM